MILVYILGGLVWLFILSEFLLGIWETMRKRYEPPTTERGCREAASGGRKVPKRGVVQLVMGYIVLLAAAAFLMLVVVCVLHWLSLSVTSFFADTEPGGW
ncbi:MAG: hypothetical protein KAX80_07820 [Planctomycetes bacterium]|nr:hypothetical protein [Planctomycetota bacterium]